MRPVVSVITPTKNRLPLLCEAIESVQAQTFADWEHIIVDDGSDDGTIEEVQRRAAADPRIRLIRRDSEKAGANGCRNIGILAAKAEYLLFLDSDDLLAPECLAKRTAIMNRNADIDFAVFRTAFFVKEPGDLGKESDPDLLGDDLVRFLFFELPWIITGPIWRKAAIEGIGAFNEDLLSWQDVDLHVRAITAGLNYLRFAVIDHHVRWAYEETKVSVEQRRSPRHLQSATNIIGGFERAVRQGPGMNWVRQRALCGLYFFVAERLSDVGHLTESIRVWHKIRVNALGPRRLFLPGVLLLCIRSVGKSGQLVAERLSNKWRGWMRLRTNPELIEP